MTDISWQQRSACGPDTAYLFWPASEAESRAFTPVAKRICADCPVLDQCRADALANYEPWGIAGGLTHHERATLKAGKPLVCRNNHDVSGPRARNHSGACRECLNERDRRRRADRKATA